MAITSNSFAVDGSSISSTCNIKTDGVLQTGKHWVLFLKPLVKLCFFLVVINAGVFIFASPFLFELSRLLVIVALLVSLFSIFITWVEAQCTHYLISSKSVQLRHGLTKTSVFELPYSSIERVEVFQTLSGRYFDYGTVKIKGNSGSYKTLTYVNNPNIFIQR